MLKSLSCTVKQGCSDMNTIYKGFLGILFLFTFYKNIDGQIDTLGITLETSVTGDYVQNFSGGIKQAKGYLGMEHLTLIVHSDDIGGWKGGKLVIDGLHTHGDAPSADFVGDYQVFNNIEAGNYLGLFEFSISQQLGKCNILFGLHDLNSEFVVSDEGSFFINSSFGIIPTISLNVPVSIFPLTALGVRISYNIGSNFSCKTAFYDGNPNNPENTRYNLNWKINSREGYLNITEISWSHCFKNENDITLNAGTFYHSAKFPLLIDSTRQLNGDYGSYIVGDYSFKHIISKHGITTGIFFQAGWAPDDRNLATVYLGGGLHSRGLLDRKIWDEIGLALAYMQVSDNFVTTSRKNQKKSETALELSYKLHLSNYYSIQPDIQYILNPGANSAISNALAGILRFNISL